ncbi:MAG: GntR family transcriptional regulator [Sphingobium sp.]|nr:MAG: GntR family transcriptional regulator [Sphingobium sp.]
MEQGKPPGNGAGADNGGGAAKPTRGPGRRLHGAIAHKLGMAILSGQYQPGDTLSGEVAFAEELEVSRSAYREAIQVLTAKGLVESRPKAGTRVLPRNRWNLLDPEVLAWAFAGEPDIQFVRDLFELTLATEAGRAADRDFHNAILNATRNDALLTLTASIGAAVNWTTQFKQRARALPRNPIPDHVRVYDAIAAGDPVAAAEAMGVLVDLALEDTASTMGR